MMRNILLSSSSSVSAANQSSPMRRMINEHARMGVRQDLFPSSETSECPLMLRHTISFHLTLFTHVQFWGAFAFAACLWEELSRI